jgi:hypothetical protein
MNLLGDKVPRLGFFRKKPWDQVMCNFELQEYGGDGGKGWVTIVEPTGSIITKDTAQEMFKPDRHYRLIARALEGPKAGAYVGVVWQHYEPFKGLLKKEEKHKEPSTPKPKEVEDVIEEYADKVEKVLSPLPKIFKMLDDIRASTLGGQTKEQSGEAENVEDWTKVPPPEFEGKLPVWAHPYFINNLFQNMKGLIDYGAKKIEDAFGVGGLPQPTTQTQKEEEEELIPSLETFKKERHISAAERQKEEPSPPTIPEEEVIEPPKEEKEEEVIPSSKEKETEEEEEEVLPSLEEKKKSGGRKK